MKADYRRELEILRDLEDFASPELRIQMLLIGAAVVVAWLTFGIVELIYWYPIHYGLIAIEKFLLKRFPGRSDAGFFYCILGVNAAIAFTFSVVPVSLWMRGEDIFQFAAMAMMVGATLNTFLLRTRVWQATLCYMSANATVFVVIALDFAVPSVASKTFFAAATLAACILVYFAVAIYEAYRSHQEHAQTRQRLFQSQKREAIGNLTGGVAHDFNNLLNIISSNLELLRDTTKSQADHSLIAHSLLAVERGAQLTKQMLAYGRRSHLVPEVIDIQQFLVQLEHLLSRVLSSRITLKVLAQQGVYDVKADPGALQAALINLCVNARDALPEGGTITILVQNVQTPQIIAPSEEIDAQHPWHLEFRITDDGVGMAPDLLSRVSEPYFSTKTPSEGSGLGLSMVAGFVEQSRGALRIESALGHGTSVTLYLPAVLPQSQQVSADHQKALPVQSSPTTTARVLLVEDEEQLRDLVSVYLKRDGHTVRAASKGDDVVGILEEGFVPDLIVTDVVMPGRMQGFDVVRYVRDRFPEIPAIVMSGYARSEDERDLPILREVTFLQKPVRLEVLSQKVSDLMQDQVQ